MSKDNGGPAFPQYNDGCCCQRAGAHDGMTLRQWYAGLAMQGLIIARRMTPDQRGWPVYIEKDAFRLADAMIAEGEK